MSKEDIDKAVREAEQFAEEDKKKREAVDIRNNADQMVYQTEKMLSEDADKFSADDKTALETKVYEAAQAAQNAQAGAQQQADPNAGQQGGNAGYTDADYTEVDDN